MSIDPPALRRAEWERRPTRSQTRPEQTAEELARRALSSQAGERLGTKEELRAFCGVSVGTFNEALRMVQSRGLVTVRSGPGGGLFATQPSPLVRFGNALLGLDEDAASVADAFRLRHALDPLIVQDALEHASAHDIAALRAALDQLKVAADSGDSAALIHANWALHARLAEISPSAMLRSFYLNLLEITDSHLLTAQPVAGEPQPEFMNDRYQLHVALVDAIAAHDRGALDIMQEHNSTGPWITAAGAGGAAEGNGRESA